MGYLPDIIKIITTEIDKSTEEFLLEYFGDYQTAIECAKYFVIESSQEFSPPTEQIKTNTYDFTINITYRVRVKNAEELESLGISKPWPDEIVILQELERRRQAEEDAEHDRNILFSDTFDRADGIIHDTPGGSAFTWKDNLKITKSKGGS